jgi:hypothetical protein
LSSVVCIVFLRMWQRSGLNMYLSLLGRIFIYAHGEFLHLLSYSCFHNRFNKYNFLADVCLSVVFDSPSIAFVSNSFTYETKIRHVGRSAYPCSS